MSAEGQTTTEYIQHHLTNLHAGEGFWALHLDTLLVSAVLGLIVFGTMWLATRKATAGVPGGMQNFVEMVVGMVDVGEQTGALPDMLMKIADDCDDQVDNAVSAMTSLLEPLMIVFLAIVVGGIVIAMFLPIIDIVNNGVGPRGSDGGDS